MTQIQLAEEVEMPMIFFANPKIITTLYENLTATKLAKFRRTKPAKGNQSKQYLCLAPVHLILLLTQITITQSDCKTTFKNKVISK